MKKLFSCLLVFVLLLCMLACTKAGPRVVESPRIDAANTKTIDIAAVNLTDSATIVTLAIDFKPGWWLRVDSATVLRADGRDYAAIGSSDNYTLSDRFTVSAGGKDTIEIIFEPLPFNTRSFDFIEDIDGGFALYGVDLTGKKTSVETATLLPAKVRDIKSEDAFEPVNDVAKTKLRFHVLNYRPEYGPLALLINSSAPEMKFVVIDLDENGEGELETNLYGTTRAGISFKQLYGDIESNKNTILLAPGVDTDIYVDAQMNSDQIAKHRNPDFTPELRVYDNGRYATLNRELFKSDLNLKDNLQEQIGYKISPDSYVEKALAQHGEHLAAIKASALPESVKDYLSRQVTVQTLGNLSEPRQTLFELYYKLHGTTNGWSDSINNDFTTAYKPEVYAIITEVVNPLDSQLKGMPHYLSSLYSAAQWPEEVTSTADYKATDRYITSDFSKAEYGNLPEGALSAYEGADPFFAKALEAAQTEAVENLKAMQERVASLPDDAPEKFFEQCIAPFKGKVVLVDLWNTWCGPCRRALKANEPLKKGELNSPDIEWVYIADTSSDPDQYAEMIKDIDGHHFMASAEQIAAIRKRFNVDGIPFYIMVDRDGVAHPRPDFRDHDEMVSTLKGAIGK